MAITAQLTDGTTTIDLIYDPGTQDEYALHYGMRVEMLETEVMQHIPDFGDSRPVRALDPDRTVFATLHVLGDDNDAVTNSLITLRRWVDGANQQALAYHMGGNVNEITFNVAASGATNTTVNSVKWGFVDDSGSFYSQYKREGGFARNVVVMLRLEPYGRAENPISARNDLYSSPHFVENSGGLGYGWSKVNGAETCTIDTTNYLIGGQSQKVVAGSDTYGIASDNVPNSSDTAAAAYAWVYVVSGTVIVQLWDVTTAAELDSATASLANADKTAVDEDGQTWWRIPVSASGFASGDDVNLFIRASGGAATFYVDGAYLELGTTSVPDFFIGSNYINNRNDPASTSSTTERQINYIDTWGIPGDAPALCTWKVTSDALIKRLYASRAADGLHLAELQEHWIEESDYSGRTANNGAFTDPTGSYSGGSYMRFTEAASPTYDGATIRYTFSGDAARRMFATNRHLYALARASTTGQTLQADVSIGNLSETLADPVSLEATSTWELLDLGILNLRDMLPETVPDSTEPSVVVQLTIAGTGASTTFDIDALPLMFIDHEILLVEFIGTGKVGGATWLVGDEKIVINENEGIAEPGVLGAFWTQAAGTIMNRNIFMDTLASNVFDITDTMSVEVQMTPRTRHLLGTI